MFRDPFMTFLVCFDHFDRESYRLFGEPRAHRQQVSAMLSIFIQYGHKLRGRPTTTLPIVLNRDLGLIDHFRLHSTDDLVKITELAKDRKQWRELSARIEKAAEASQTVNWDATRQ